jgi:hypothetical protein
LALAAAQPAFADDAPRILVCGEGFMDAGEVVDQLTESGYPAVEVPPDFTQTGATFDFEGYDAFVAMGSVLFDLVDGCLADIPFGWEMSDIITRHLMQPVPPVTAPPGMEAEFPIVSSRLLSSSTWRQYGDLRVVVFLDTRGQDGLEALATEDITRTLEGR